MAPYRRRSTGNCLKIMKAAAAARGAGEPSPWHLSVRTEHAHSSPHTAPTFGCLFLHLIVLVTFLFAVVCLPLTCRATGGGRPHAHKHGVEEGEGVENRQGVRGDALHTNKEKAAPPSLPSASFACRAAVRVMSSSRLVGVSSSSAAHVSAMARRRQKRKRAASARGEEGQLTTYP